MEIEALRVLCRNDKIKWTLHALKRIKERKISASSVIDAVMVGDTIELYQDDKPFLSRLIFNASTDSPLHVVVSTDGDSLYITTYIQILTNGKANIEPERGKNNVHLLRRRFCSR